MVTGKHRAKGQSTKHKEAKKKQRGGISSFIHHQSHYLIDSLRYLTFKRLMKATFADALFYLFAISFGLIFANFMRVKITDLLPDIDMSTFKNTAAIDSVINSFNTLMAIFFIVTVTYFLLLVIFWAVFKGSFWSILMKRSYSMRYVLNYFWLSLLWLGIWTGIFIGSLFLFKDSVIVGVMLLFGFLFLHTSIPVYIVFTKENKIKHALKEGLSIAIGGIHHFLIPYAFIIIFYVGLMVSILFPLLRMATGGFAGIISGLFTIVFLVWCRVYLLEMIAYHAGYQMR